MKKGFTLLELVIVTSLISILAVNLAPKVITQINKSKVSKVMVELSDLRRDIEIEEVNTNDSMDSLDDFNNRLNFDYTTLEATGIPKNKNFYAERTNEGGWLYNSNTDEIYANLPNGAYTGKDNWEVWNDEIIPYTSTGKDLASFGDNPDSDFEYDSVLGTLLRVGDNRTGYIYFSQENTKLSELSSVTIKTNSELHDKNNGGWELVSSNENDGTFIYKKTYSIPLNTNALKAKNRRQKIRFKKNTADSMISEISYN